MPRLTGSPHGRYCLEVHKGAILTRFDAISRPLFVFTLILLTITAAQFASAEGPYQRGSSNTVTADPAVKRPPTTPCVVNLFTSLEFADFNAKSFTYRPPAACQGPWAKVVFEADVNVTAGVQFDRTANFWIGGANIYFGTTAEPGSNLGPSWHVESDLTDYSPLFNVTQAGQADIFNLVDSTYTGIIYSTANLEFYPLSAGQTAPVTADAVYALSAGPDGGTVALSTTTSLLSQTLTLPMNIERAYLDVYAQSQSGDEFWYTCVPNDVSSELFSCGNTGFREAEVTIDGTSAGVAPIFPWIFTGGIDPYLWFPLAGTQTLNFTPFRVDLTPFAATLSNGQPHTVAVSVYNANNYFSATASLLVYEDHGSTQVTGATTRNTIGAGPNPVVAENLINNNGNVNGTVKVTSLRNYEVAGYVNTSHGLVVTQIDQKNSFSNAQGFHITTLAYIQNIAQNTTVTTTTRTTENGVTSEADAQYNFPLVVDIAQSFKPSGAGSLLTSIQQEYQRTETDLTNGVPTYRNSLIYKTDPTDTLLISGGSIVGNVAQSSSQQYTYSDSTGACYDLTLTASKNVLTGVQPGCGRK